MKRKVQFLVSLMVMLFVLLGLQPDAAFSSSLRDEMIVKAKKEGTLVIAGSVADNIKRDLIGFQKRYPFIKIRDLDLNTKSAVNRVSLEAKAGRLSIDWVGISEDGAEIFVRRGLNAKYEFPHLKDFVPGSQPPHGMYVGGAANLRVQGVYNTDLIKPEEVPKSWEEMTDPRFKGKTMFSRSAEEIPGRLAWLWRDKDGKWDWDRAFDFFTRLKAHDPVIASGFVSGTNRVAAGEAAIFWFTPPGPAARMAVLQKAPLSLIAVPKFFGGLRAWSIFKATPHPASAWLLTDYLTSPEGQFELTERIMGFTPLNKKARLGKLANWIAERGGTVENVDLIDLSKLDEIYSDAVQEKSEQFFFKLLGLR
ncbi:MAG: extracellular solute-binding protein [Desulfobacterales bacterium]|nr:extracellular solute-binding protein [Desulfobacterales bacterium]